MFSWWTFTDIFEEGGMRAEPFSNAFGLQNIYGVAKPVFRAFEQLNSAGDLILNASIGSGSSAISAFATVISGSPRERFRGARIFLTNFRRQDMPIAADTAVLLIAHGAMPAPTYAAVSLIDSTHTNPRALWESWGSPMYPTPTMLAELQAASQLQEQSVPLQRVSDTVVSLSIPLEPYASAFVHF